MTSSEESCRSSDRHIVSENSTRGRHAQAARTAASVPLITSSTRWAGKGSLQGCCDGLFDAPSGFFFLGCLSGVDGHRGKLRQEGARIRSASRTPGAHFGHEALNGKALQLDWRGGAGWGMSGDLGESLGHVHGLVRNSTDYTAGRRDYSRRVVNVRDWDYDLRTRREAASCGALPRHIGALRQAEDARANPA